MTGHMILLQDFLEPLYLSENNKSQRRQCDGCQNNKTKSMWYHQNDGNTGHAFHDGVHIVGYDGSKCVHGSG